MKFLVLLPDLGKMKYVLPNYEVALIIYTFYNKTDVHVLFPFIILFLISYYQ